MINEKVNFFTARHCDLSEIKKAGNSPDLLVFLVFYQPIGRHFCNSQSTLFSCQSFLNQLYRF
ncbi:MAG: hypothetical protein ACI9HK_003562 [Pirellulaceae bacterium]|jgi:hypothetical protein